MRGPPSRPKLVSPTRRCGCWKEGSLAECIEVLSMLVDHTTIRSAFVSPEELTDRPSLVKFSFDSVRNDRTPCASPPPTTSGNRRGSGARNRTAGCSASAAARNIAKAYTEVASRAVLTVKIGWLLFLPGAKWKFHSVPSGKAERQYNYLIDLMCRATDSMATLAGTGNPDAFEDALKECVGARVHARQARNAIVAHRATHGC
jgi:hypothetical protein